MNIYLYCWRTITLQKRGNELPRSRAFIPSFGFDLYYTFPCAPALSDQGCVQRLDYCDPNHVLFNGTSTQPQLINSFRKKIN